MSACWAKLTALKRMRSARSINRGDITGDSDAIEIPHENALVGEEMQSDFGDTYGSGGSSALFSLERSVSYSPEDGDHPAVTTRSLKTFAGVFSPVALSMFSTVLFLRLGFIVGQAGIIHTMLQFGISYFILYMTILSICAISTNGEVEGGGAYFMISRALGPAFGGSIGFLFFLANIIACALYVTGFVEGITENFGPGGQLLEGGTGIPGGTRWWTYLYTTIILFFCLGVCVIGGEMFARMSIGILVVIEIVIFTVVLSFFIMKPYCVDFDNKTADIAGETCSNYTGLSTKTFLDNVQSSYANDTSGRENSFLTIFAILFSSVTGIMNGANMSGELKDPSKSIPRGTLAATTFTLGTYIVLAFFTAASCERDLLLYNYLYMQKINVWSPFIVIGLFAATLSASLGNLIGASRILLAIAKDQLYGKLFNFALITSRSGNPYVSVIFSWFLVQVVLLIGSLNAISPLASVFFLLSYAATNLACLALTLTSAPNFRPTFRYFGWPTAALGLAGCMVMCFLVNAIYASVAVIACMALTIGMLLREWPASWGSISQALIFHQVRKYLLMLDSRKSHIRYWRPQMLLLVSNPRSATGLIEFINDIKKSGLYIIGHVVLGDLDAQDTDPIGKDNNAWLTLIDQIKVKAFVELTLAKTIREGMQHLMRISGLGGMKPNTICLGFYDNTVPEDLLLDRIRETDQTVRNTFHNRLPRVRTAGQDRELGPIEYVQMVSDAIKLRKNVCLCRYFSHLNKQEVFSSKTQQYIDVWPLNFFSPDSAYMFENTQLYMLQLACILTMVPKWKGSTKLRVFLCVDPDADDTLKKERKLDHILHKFRIKAQVQLVPWNHVTCLLESPSTEADSQAGLGTPRVENPTDVADNFLHAVRELVSNQSENTAVTFMYLPKPPQDVDRYEAYLRQLDVMSHMLPPTVFVYGQHPVITTTL